MMMLMMMLIIFKCVPYVIPTLATFWWQQMAQISQQAQTQTQGRATKR